MMENGGRDRNTKSEMDTDMLDDILWSAEWEGRCWVWEREGWRVCASRKVDTPPLSARMEWKEEKKTWRKNKESLQLDRGSYQEKVGGGHGGGGVTFRDEKLLGLSLPDMSSKKGCKLGGAVTDWLSWGAPLVSRWSPTFCPWEKRGSKNVHPEINMLDNLLNIHSAVLMATPCGRINKLLLGHEPLPSPLHTKLWDCGVNE